MRWASRSKSPAQEPESIDSGEVDTVAMPGIESRFRELQRAVGNRAVLRAFHGAARVADQPQRQVPPAGSTGEALAPKTRAEMEPLFGRRFDDVRLHTDPAAASSAEAIDATAYTAGRDIYFARGMYAPESPEGRHLVAHELAHIAQQDAGTSDGYSQRISSSSDPAEREAERAASNAAAGHPAGPVGRSGSAIARDDKKHPESHEAEREKESLAEAFDAKDAVSIHGDPAADPNYVQNAIRGVGIAYWGGPFRLDRQVINGMGVDSLYLPRNEVNLEQDPLQSLAVAIKVIYKSRAAADAVLSKSGYPGSYTYYIGPGGLIYPTIISDTTAPQLCTAMRKAADQERADARVAEKTSTDLLLWYVGARFPMKTSSPSSGQAAVRTGAGVPTVARAAGGGSTITFVEIGAGDLKASIDMARKSVGRVIAVDPAVPSTEAIRELEAAGGSFVRGTAADVGAGTADHVIQYFPWRISGTGGRVISGGTFRLVEDSMRLLKPGGMLHVVTEDLETAEYLAAQASKRGAKVVLTETTAGAAAPGASGAGVPGFSSSSKVWLVNIYP